MFVPLRDVPGVEVLIEQHQTRKVEIDAREDSFQDVVKMGKDLIARNHYATPEVKVSFMSEIFIFVLTFCISLLHMVFSMTCFKKAIYLVSLDSTGRLIIAY